MSVQTVYTASPTQTESVDLAPQPTSTRIPERTLHLFEQMVQSAEGVRIETTQRSIRYLETIDHWLDTKSFSFQKKIDGLGTSLERLFAPIRNRTLWISSDVSGPWYRQLALLLVKLPLRAARNVVKMLYNILYGCAYFAVHPLKSIIHIAKLTVSLLSSLLTPEMWANIGSGLIGGSCGVCLITGSPFPLIGALIGGALILGGISFSVFKAALLKETGEKGKAILTMLRTTSQQMIEAALSGFLLGMAAGGVQRALHAAKLNAWCPSNGEASEFVKDFIRRNHLSESSVTWRIEGNEIAVCVDTGKFTWTKIHLQPHTTLVEECYFGPDYSYSSRVVPLSESGFTGPFYPTCTCPPMANHAITLGTTTGLLGALPSQIKVA